MMKTLTLLNERGDTTLAWDESADDQMRETIKKKMEEGMQFFLLKPRIGGIFGHAKVKIKKVGEAMDARAVILADADFAALIAGGTVGTTETPKGEIETTGIAKTADDVINHGTAAGTKKLKGG